MRRQLMLALLAASTARAQHVNPSTGSADAAQAGTGLFRQHCGSGYGRRGQGGRAPDLTRTSFVTGNADADLFRTISNGIPGTDMGAYQGYFLALDPASCCDASRPAPESTRFQ